MKSAACCGVSTEEAIVLAHVRNPDGLACLENQPGQPHTGLPFPVACAVLELLEAVRLIDEPL